MVMSLENLRVKDTSETSGWKIAGHVKARECHFIKGEVMEKVQDWCWVRDCDDGVS